jgi:AbiV family abortive infection protein
MKIEEFLSQFSEGAIDTEEIGRGMNLCFTNAEALIEDAKILRISRPGRSISLAVLALEEIGKIFLLVNVAAVSSEELIPWKRIQKDLKLKSHRAKQTAFAVYGKNLLDKLKWEESSGYSKTRIPESIINLLDRFKQLGFYVDSFNGQFISPIEFGESNEDWADWLISLANERLDSIRPMHNSEEASMKVAHASALLFAELGGETIQGFQGRLQEWIEGLLKNSNNSSSKHNDS